MFSSAFFEQFIWIVGAALAVAFLLYIRKNRPRSGMSRSSTHNLDRYAIDLTASARAGTLDPVVGRDDEIHRIIQVLTRRTKNNVLLIGLPGVGKTAAVEGLAQRISSGDVPDILSHKRVLLLQVSELLAGTKYRGEFEQRIKGIVQEIRGNKRSIILFIDEIHTITQAKGTEGAVDLSDILKPALARGDLQLIGATTQKEYEQYIQPDESWDRRFQVVLVNEPTTEESIKILQGIKEKYEEFHHVVIGNEAIASAVRLSQEYIKGRHLPDKAIDIIDEAAAMVNIERGSAHERAAAILHGAAKKACINCDDIPAVVSAEHVKEIVAEWTGIEVKDIH